jgi:hypothetical protein
MTKGLKPKQKFVKQKAKGNKHVVGNKVAEVVTAIVETKPAPPKMENVVPKPQREPRKTNGRRDAWKNAKPDGLSTISFGNHIAVDRNVSNVDETITIEGTPIVTVIKDICRGIISLACTAGLAVEKLNTSYAYNYLVKYMLQKMIGEDPAYELKMLPAVLWDILDATSSRTVKGISYFVGNVTLPAAEEVNATTFGLNFGICGAPDTNKFVKVDVTVTGYTDQLGFTALRKLFEDAAKILDCVTREQYPREIKINDVSAWSVLDYDLSTNPNGTFTTLIGGVSVTVGGTVHTTRKSRCHWISKLGLFSGLKISGSKHILRRTSSAGAIVVDRVLRKQRNYEDHKRHVLVKQFALNDISDVFQSLVKALKDKYTSTPFLDNLVGSNDFLLMFHSIMIRYFMPWCAVGAGYQSTTMWQPTAIRFIAPDHGGVPMKGSSGIKGFQILEENLARILPYPHKGSIVYPLPAYRNDVAILDAACWHATGYYTTKPNFQLGYLTGDAAFFFAPCVWESFGLRSTEWHGAMRQVQEFTPVCPIVVAGKTAINLATITCHRTKNTRFAYGYSSISKLPDQFEELAERSIIPELASDESTLYTTDWRQLYEERYWSPNSRAEGTQVNTVYPGMLGSLHKLGGQGDRDALISRGEVLARRSLAKEVGEDKGADEADMVIVENDGYDAATLLGTAASGGTLLALAHRIISAHTQQRRQLDNVV